MRLDAETPAFAAPIPCVDWQRQGLTLPDLRKLLLETTPERLRLNGVPDARLFADQKLLSWLSDDEDPETVGQWRDAMRKMPAVTSNEPEALWDLGSDLGYAVDITPVSATRQHRYDVMFSRSEAEAIFPAISTAADTKSKPWSAYATNPLRLRWAEDFASHLVPQLRSFLQEKLPHYMVPSHFILLDSLPLTPNGKLNRKALPAPDQSRPELADSFVAPRTPNEEMLAKIWCEVLNFDRVGINDNFFELGGHSLLATQVVSRIRATLEVELPLRSLFESPTVAGLAEVIVQSQMESAGPEQIARLLTELSLSR